MKMIRSVLNEVSATLYEQLACRMNQTLEATARAIFKSWFVDFDPVQTLSSIVFWRVEHTSEISCTGRFHLVIASRKCLQVLQLDIKRPCTVT